MKKIITILSCAMLAALPLERAKAQESGSQEISVTGGFGLSSLKYSVSNGDVSKKAGGSFGVGYSYFLNKNFSLNTGLELSFYNTKASMNNFEETFNAFDSENDAFELRAKINGYEEKQTAMYLSIPVMGQFQTPVIGEHQFYVALGVKLGFPVSAKYKPNSAMLTTSGYYSEDGLLIDDIPSQGFGTFQSSAAEKDLDLKLSVMLAAELGMKWVLTRNNSLYTGFFLDYGLNDVRKNTGEQFLLYNAANPSRYENNSIANSKFGDKMMPFSAGIKLRLSFNIF